jgi:Tol biopolymer transport system component
MDMKRWQEIQSTFDTIVEMDDADRAKTLSALSTSDPGLHAAVERLLAADSDADARLASLDSVFAPQSAPPLAPLDVAVAPGPEPGPDPLGLSGHTVSHFQVLEALGVGGMGVVYRGQDTRLGRAVALKFLLPHYTLDASAKARFLREARAAAALDHPHLCTIHDIGEAEDGRLFLAMPLYGGETLKARLGREGPLAVAEAVEITRQIVRGLGCAHAAGIIHRDLKPGNVMLLPDGTVKVLDFGLAKALDETTSATSAGFGTAAYMAPEQIRGEPVDARADVWAVGVVLYQMLTGRKPFAGVQDVAIAHAILHAEPLAPSVLREGVPGAVEEIVLGLLRKDPSARYAGVDDLLADLAALGTLEETTERKGRNRWLRPTHRRVAAWQWLMSLGAVVVIGWLGVKAITSWLYRGPPKPVSRYSIALPDAELAVAGNRYYRIAISPDGKRLVYVGASPDGRTQLWMRALDQLHARPLVGTEGAANPFFSHDGSRLGFLATGGRGVLKVVSLDGGPPATVTDSAVDLGGAAWGYDGYIYFDGQLQGNGLARVPENGGVPQPVTRRDEIKGETWHYQPAPLPNGRGVLFVVAHGAASYQNEIAVLDLKSGVYHVLLHGLSPRYAASGHLVYVTAGGALMAAPFDQDRLALVGEPAVLVEGLGVAQNAAMQDLTLSATGTVVYTTSTGASKELVWVARDGTATPIDSTWRAGFSSVALSPDGAELAVGVRGDNTEVWVKPLGQGQARKLKSLGGINDFPAWTADGRAVTLLSNMGSRSSPNLNLYVSQADGSDFPQRLLSKAGSLQDAEYSRDGKWLVYRRAADLFAVRTAGDTTPIPLVATRFLEASPRLSPDGRWLAYSSDESGDITVYVRPFPNTASAKWRVSDGADPLWSRSGRELFYKNGRAQLVAVPVLAGDTFALGRQEVLFSISEYENYWQWRDYDVAPDGRHFVMIRSAGKPRDELIVVENFFEELKEKLRR